MMVQKCVRDDLKEDYDTGDYLADTSLTPEEKYEEYRKNRSNILLYQWGVWCTSYAMRNLFRLGSCVSGIWLYSDTDSCYATSWDHEKVEAYNESCREKLKSNGYAGVMHNGREYWPGVAEPDGIYSEFKTLGAKRYCCRDAETGKLKITVAGVPKKGVLCLDDDIANFRQGLIFPGIKTDKLMHTYLYKDDIYVDEDGNETGDSIDLTPCDYLLDQIRIYDLDEILTEDISINYYDEGDLIYD